MTKIQVLPSWDPSCQSGIIIWSQSSYIFSKILVYMLGISLSAKNYALSHWFVIWLTSCVWLWACHSQEVPPTPGQAVKEPMFIPVALGLLDSTGKDIPLSSVYHDGTLQSVSSNDQPVYTTVLRVTKVSSELLRLPFFFFLFCVYFPFLLNGPTVSH